MRLNCVVTNKFYCHYDASTLEILQIGSDENCDITNNSIIKSFIIPSKKALSILSGESNSSDWKIVINHSIPLLVNNNKKNITKFNPVEIVEVKNPDVKLNIANNELSVCINNYEKIQELDNIEILFFITKKKDLSILFDKIKLNILNVDEKIKINIIGNDFSIYTFPSTLNFSR